MTVALKTVHQVYGAGTVYSKIAAPEAHPAFNAMMQPIQMVGPRNRATQADLALLHDQIYDVLSADHPQSVRHVYYRMTDPRLPFPVPKDDNGYRQVQRELVKLRQTGVVEYGWISDSTRMGHFVSTFNDASDFINRMASGYRADVWRDLPDYCEVWCESRSIAGVIRSLCDEYGVDLYPCGGFPSLTFAYEAAQQTNWQHRNRKLHVLYIGDYDPAGVLIDQSLKAELARHLNDDVDWEFTRPGITEQQIADYNLPTKPRKATDNRSQHVKATVEAEAMPAGILRQLLRDQFDALIPSGSLDAIRAAERSEQDFLRRMAEYTEENRAALEHVMSDFYDEEDDA